MEDIRVWNLNDHREILRITVPNMECFAVTITVDGKSILSGQSYHTHTHTHTHRALSLS